MEWLFARRQRWFEAPCHLCRRDTLDIAGLCPDCSAEWRALLGRPRCSSCGLIRAGSVELDTCGACAARPWPFDGVVAAVDLEPSVRELIHRFKYQRDFSVLPLLQRTLAEALIELPDEALPEALVPMPLHPSQCRRRGFNQAWLLADGVRRAIDRPLLKRGLRRVRDTGSLTAQSASERRRTLKGAFATDRPMPMRVAIVDDVLTTGASAAALAAELRRAGAESITVWVLARTP
ncbi:MAG TPA: ComF family protein [Guyparkeria sp.]|nr:ComF family protein [Guyparkeria sp.]